MNDTVAVWLYNSELKAKISIADADVVAGRRCSLSSGGYVLVHLGSQQREFLHRLIMDLPQSPVDHADRDKLNNERTNLRVATRAENLWNRGAAVGNKSGFKGVYFDYGAGRYRAEIKANKQRYILGRFDTAEQAAAAYDAKAIEVHGPFAHLNFPLVITEDGGNRRGQGCGEP